MINEKQEILEVVNSLPDDITWDDAIYTLYLHLKFNMCKDDIENGRLITLEEFDKERKELYESYSIKHSKARYE